MSYTPTPSLANSVEDLRRWMVLELQRVASAFIASQTPTIPVLTAAPAKPQDGQFAIADGTHWNPGHGAGLYYYLGGVWKFVA